MATMEQLHKLDQYLQIIRESSIELIDNKQVSNDDLLIHLYNKGFSFLQDQGNQNIVDIGSIGLAYAIRRIDHAGQK